MSELLLKVDRYEYMPVHLFAQGEALRLWIYSTAYEGQVQHRLQDY